MSASASQSQTVPASAAVGALAVVLLLALAACIALPADAGGAVAAVTTGAFGLVAPALAGLVRLRARRGRPDGLARLQRGLAGGTHHPDPGGP